jgi:putative transferase (TIGR04331 family)
MRLILLNCLNSLTKNKINLISSLYSYSYSKRNLYKNYPCIFKVPCLNDFESIERLERKKNIIKESVLQFLSCELNKLHGLNYNKRVWSILLGHWLDRFVSMVLNRYYLIDDIIKNDTIHEIALLNIDYEKINVEKISNDTVFLANKNELNSRIYYHIIKFFHPSYINKIIYFNEDKIPNVQFEPENSFRSIIIYFFKKIFNFFISSRNKYFIYKSFLSKSDSFKLNIKFLQIPFLESFKKITIQSETKNDFRKSFSCIYDKEIKIENFFITNIFLFLPKVFLEDFKFYNNAHKKFFFPKNPKVILTSNGFDVDEVFKFYLAKNVSLGTKYLVAQHGAQYGVNQFYLNRNEEETSDRFFTWGWSLNKIHYQGVCLLPKLKVRTLESNGILIVQKCIDNRINLHDEYYNYELYFQNQLNLIKSLNKKIRNNLVVRLMSGFRNEEGYESKRLLNFNCKINIDFGHKPFSKVFDNYNLLVFTYDSTAFYEAIISNRPCLLVLLDPYYITSKSKPFFDQLNKIGIVHYDFNSASVFINSNYNTIFDWWNLYSVQKSILEFTKQFSNHSLEVSEELYSFIKNY